MNQKEQINLEIDKWWSIRRKKYNKGLVISGVLAFIVYCIVGLVLIKGFEVTLITTFFQGIGYLLMILVANIFYSLGAIIDKTFNSSNSDYFRKRLYKTGYWFSVLLPFVIPSVLLFRSFVSPLAMP